MAYAMVLDATLQNDGYEIVWDRTRRVGTDNLEVEVQTNEGFMDVTRRPG